VPTAEGRSFRSPNPQQHNTEVVAMDAVATVNDTLACHLMKTENDGADSKTVVKEVRWKSTDTTATATTELPDVSSDDDASTAGNDDTSSEVADSDEDATRCHRSRSSSSSSGRESLTSEAVEADVSSASEVLERVGQEGLVIALAHLMKHLVVLGQRVHRATIFHAANPPQIELQDYLARLATFYMCSDGCLILALVYIDRIVKMHPDFVVCSLNIHRLISTSLLLAAKFNDDVFYPKKYYAKVAGVGVDEFNRLEEKFLHLIDWRLCVLPEEFDEYLGRLLVPGQEPHWS